MAFVIRTIKLVYNNRVSNIIHNNPLKAHVRRHAVSRIRPRLNPNAVIGVGERAISHGDPFDGLLIGVLPEAADADAVAGGPTGDPLHSDLLAPVPEGDAVVASLDFGVGYAEVEGAADVDAVCV